MNFSLATNQVRSNSSRQRNLVALACGKYVSRVSTKATTQFVKWLFCLLLAIGEASADMATATVQTEAAVRGGAYATQDQDEAAAGYVMVKHSPVTSPDFIRKAYFQFNLTGRYADTNLPATFTVRFLNSYKQRVKLWALKQDYPGFASTVAWNQAQANELSTGELLTNGAFTAKQISGSVVIPITSTTPYSFTVPKLGDFLSNNRVTFVLTGDDDDTNSSAGLRLARQAATLDFTTLNTTNHFDVYLASGQSNMDGRGSASDLTGPLSVWNLPQTDVRIYYVNPINLDPFQPTYNTGWQTLRPGWSVPPGFSGTLPSTRFGPELSFARAMADANPERHIAIIKISQGGTSLAGDWNPASGYLYVTLTNFARTALQLLTAGGSSYTLRGMIWHQGESDGSSSTAVYQARLTEFISSVRRDLEVTNLPFVVGELATNRSLTVRAAQLNVSQELPYVSFASSSNLPTLAPDDPHFTSSSVITMGQRMAASLETPPLQFDVITRANGNVVMTAFGLAGSSCRLLHTTNLQLPVNQWVNVHTGRFDSFGSLSFTNPVAVGSRGSYFRLVAQ